MYVLKAGANRTTYWPTCYPTNKTNMLVRFALTTFLFDQHVTNMSIHLIVVFLKKHSKFYDFDIRIVKKTFEFKSHVGLHRKPHQHVILARFYKFVGQHFSFIFANQTNMLVRCWSKYWPTCCPEKRSHKRENGIFRL